MGRLGSASRAILLVSLPSLVLSILLLEVLARLFLPVSDVPATYFDPVLGNHFVPNQTGRYIKRHGAEVSAQYRINSDGWNSPHDYAFDKKANTFRIAVIGDSYVEALQVDYDKSYPALLEKKLNSLDERRCSFEVFSFGHSGASLMQYAAVLRAAVLPLQPDLLILNVVQNDLHESLTEFGRSDNWTIGRSLGSVEEVPPRLPSRLWLRRVARNSALIRYLVVNWDLPARIRILKDLMLGDLRRYEANVDVTAEPWQDESALEISVALVADRLAVSLAECRCPLLLVVDGNRTAIYEGNDPTKSKTYLVNRMMRKLAQASGSPLLDLTEVYERLWQDQRRRFESRADYHWNEYGHSVVARAILTKLLEEGLTASCLGGVLE